MTRTKSLTLFDLTGYTLIVNKGQTKIGSYDGCLFATVFEEVRKYESRTIYRKFTTSLTTGTTNRTNTAPSRNWGAPSI